MPITKEVLENLKNSELDEIIEIIKDIKAQRFEYEKYRILNAFHKLADEAKNAGLTFYDEDECAIDPNNIYLE